MISFARRHGNVPRLGGISELPERIEPIRPLFEAFDEAKGLLFSKGTSTEGLGARENPLFACSASAASRSSQRMEAKSAVRKSDPTVLLGDVTMV